MVQTRWARSGAVVSVVTLSAFLGLVGCADDEEADAGANAEAVCPLPAKSRALAEGDARTFVQLDAGGYQRCGLAQDGSVTCWGRDFGLVEVPAAVAGVEQAWALAADDLGGCVIREGGSVVCWDRDGAAAVPGVCGAEAITANHCAIVSGGKVRCWDVANPGALGAAEADAERGPLEVPGVEDAVSLASGSSDYTCAALADGSVMCWGGGPRGGDRPGTAPALVPEVSGAVSLVGARHSSQAGDFSAEMCAILGDGSVTCWTHARAPSVVEGLSEVVSLSLSTSHACALSSDKLVRCWGDNQRGQLGDGTTENRSAPTLVEGLTDVVQVTTGGRDNMLSYSCALSADGSAWCWGADSQLLESGIAVETPVPVAVTLP